VVTDSLGSSWVSSTCPDSTSSSSFSISPLTVSANLQPKSIPYFWLLSTVKSCCFGLISLEDN
jgi:hypothetical protein